jgi:hypothetical protein
MPILNLARASPMVRIPALADSGLSVLAVGPASTVQADLSIFGEIGYILVDLTRKDCHSARINHR